MRITGGNTVAVALAFVLAGVFALPSFPKADDVQRMLDKAHRFQQRQQNDSALAVYRKITSDYRYNLGTREKEQYVDALYACFDINIRNGLYNAAFTDLVSAEEVTEAENMDKSKLHARYSALYVVLASQTGKEKYMNLSLEHGRKAFWDALKREDWATVGKAYGNLLNAFQGFRDESLIRKETEALRKLEGKNWQVRTLLLDFKRTKAFTEGNYLKAAQYYDSLMQAVPDIPANDRTRVAVTRDYGIALGLGGKPDEAFRVLDTVIALSYGKNLRDIRLSALNAGAFIAEETGNKVMEDRYTAHASALKDSLRAYNIADDAVELEYVRDRKDLQQQIAKSREHRRNMMFGLIGVCAIAVVVIAFTVILARKNRLLEARAEILRERMREFYINRDIPKAVPAVLPDSPGTPRKKEGKEENAPEKEAQEEEPVKYQGSTLSAEEKTQIAALIESALKKDTIYSSDFSLNNLAKSVGYHPKAVSQVINEVFKVNFPTLVNRLRIAEACRIFDDPRYSNWSIEGIAESVGFKSRTSFSANFKKITGITYKEYRKKCQLQEVDNTLL